MIKALALCGHLDDSIIAIGGTIGKIVAEGGEVNVVCFGNGDEGYENIRDRDTAAAKFKKEAEKAHKILGVSSFMCFDYPDFEVPANRETYRLCIQAIRKYKPDIIFSHYWKEYFQHRNMARLATDSWWQSGWKCSGELGKEWQAKKLYYFEVIHLLEQPTHIIDVSKTFAGKIEAWKCLASQDACYSTMITQMESRAMYYGTLIGVKYAEALKLSTYMPQAIRKISEL